MYLCDCPLDVIPLIPGDLYDLSSNVAESIIYTLSLLKASHFPISVQDFHHNGYGCSHYLIFTA